MDVPTNPPIDRPPPDADASLDPSSAPPGPAATDAPSASASPHPEGERASFYASPLWRRLYGFLLGPALIAAAVLAMFTLFSVLTTEESDPGELVQALESGGEHRRWQAAFALTKYLQPSVAEENAVLLRESDASYRQKLEQVQALVPKLLSVWNDPARGDPQVRRFLALAFGYLGDPRLAPALAGSLADPDIELVHYCLAGLAGTADVAARRGEHPAELDGATLQAVLGASRRPEQDVRATAIYVLGVLGQPEAMARVREALTDEAPAVAWNAAFALARHNDLGGEAILAELLDRGPLFRAVGDDPMRQRDLFLNAVRSAGNVRSPKLDERLSRIAQGDADLVARQAALEVLRAREAKRVVGDQG